MSITHQLRKIQHEMEKRLATIPIAGAIHGTKGNAVQAKMNMPIGVKDPVKQITYNLASGPHIHTFSLGSTSERTRDLPMCHLPINLPLVNIGDATERRSDTEQGVTRK
jgi:hypothetical protein